VLFYITALYHHHLRRSQVLKWRFRDILFDDSCNAP
jgi:hypothetical protein